MVCVRDPFRSQSVKLPLRKSKPTNANSIAEACWYDFPTAYMLSTPYKDEHPKAALLPSLLFFSTTSSSRLMTLLPVNRFSSGFVSLAHVLSPLSQSPIPNKFINTTLQLLSRRYINPRLSAQCRMQRRCYSKKKSVSKGF